MSGWFQNGILGPRQVLCQENYANAGTTSPAMKIGITKKISDQPLILGIKKGNPYCKNTFPSFYKYLYLIWIVDKIIFNSKQADFTLTITVWIEKAHMHFGSNKTLQYGS